MAERTTGAANLTEARFAETHWSVILAAASQQEPGAQEALEHLCRIYWAPLYGFLRKQGRSPEDAKDLTQGFFGHLLRANRLEQAHPAEGKFRSWLLAGLQNYAHNERDKERTLKRGGGREMLSLDASDTEHPGLPEPAVADDPAKAYERQWAATLIDHVRRQLKANYAQAGKSESFEILQPFLVGDAARGGYAEAASQLRLSQGAARVAATRLREEFRTLLRAEVGQTVSSPVEIDDEIRYLLKLFRSS